MTGALLSVLAISGVLAGAAAAGTSDTYAYVTNQTDGTVQPIDITTHTAGAPVSLGAGTQPSAFALAPKGSANAGTAYIVEQSKDQVAVLDVATDPAVPTVTTTIPTGSRPVAIAVTPNGDTAYVANSGDGTVTAITLTGSSHPTRQIKVGGNPQAIAITPNGELAYVIRGGNTPVVPIITSTNTVGPGFGGVGGNPIAVAINPNGKTGYVVSASSAQLVPFSIPEEAASQAKAISTAPGPWALTTTADGSSALVINALFPTGLAKINLSTGATVGSDSLTAAPWSLTLGPQGTAYANDAYVVEQNGSSAGSVAAVNLTTMATDYTVPVGVAPSAIVVSPWIPAVTGTGGDPYNLGDLGIATKHRTPPKPTLRGRSIKVGNQQVMLDPIVRGALVKRGRRLCVSPRATLIFKLTTRRLRRGPGTRVTHVLMLLGRHREASKGRTPVVVRLRHLRKGSHAEIAKLDLVEHRVERVRRHHRRVKVHRTVHLHRMLRVGFSVC